MLFLPVRYFICLFGTKSFNLCLQVGYLSLVLGGICLNFVQFFTCAFIAPFPILTLIHSSSRGRGRGDNFTCFTLLLAGVVVGFGFEPLELPNGAGFCWAANSAASF